MARRKNSIWSPQSAPHLAEKLAAYSERMADFFLEAPVATRLEEYEFHKVASEHEMIRRCATDTPIHWIARDLCDVVTQTYESVPEWSPSEVLPGPSGFVFFEKSPASPVRFEGFKESEVPVDAIAWLTENGRLLVAIMARTSLVHKAAMEMGSYLKDAPMHSVYSLNLDPDKPQGAGRLDPSMLTGTGDTPPAYATDEEEMSAVLSLVGTTWLLMGQRGVTETRKTTAPRSARQRKAEARGESVPDVVVTEHSLSAAMAQQGRGTGTGRTATTRWWVRGHWRQQACGPGRSQRRPVYIAPHTAGAAGAEIDTRKRVHRHRA